MRILKKILKYFENEKMAEMRYFKERKKMLGLFKNFC